MRRPVIEAQRRQVDVSAPQLKLTTKPNSAVVDKFFSEYRHVFSLPRERETLAGFRNGLRMNKSDYFQRHYGPSCEYIGYLHTEAGEFVAGLNFICFPMLEFNLIAIHSIYIFIAENWRAKGMLLQLYQIMEDVAVKYAEQFDLPTNADILMFGEQNDPFKMSVRDYLSDGKASKIDQFDRISIWAQLKARLVLIPYVQPPLRSRSKPDTTLFLRVIFKDDMHNPFPRQVREIDPCMMYECLRRYVTFAIQKGRSASSRDSEEQFEYLKQLMVSRKMVKAILLPTDFVVKTIKNDLIEKMQKSIRRKSVSDFINLSSMKDAITKYYNVQI
jgi:hypothetical protein